ncbi:MULTISPECIES: ABC transporter ATP-binding protein [Halomicrobium]|uniref:ABC transporter related n=2 Tax=Halomicrobium mukohataei TaxID=57705 RepID=C7P010_HALMD|nr:MULTISPECIES: ABC transporter ATP-binding protein [Halomicrobium]ACV46918.1 ABC transporter related [Halomicrobium mukohataei DSM 12286]QCD65417.1 ABC transporter ATP-binding protein [Halomicrobium mukohataei]QFR20223.1 ATP-binding cassette domain-containing protein [Halomicrobium sp. ZPS1]
MPVTPIEISGLTKRYGEVVALDGVDLTVERGEAFGFLGPNGAGKSTTIHALLGIVDPTAGTAKLFGHDVTKNAKRVRERVGVVSEGSTLYDRLTAREHLALTARMKGSERDPAQLLKLVGLSDAADRPVGEFSKGMIQRLSLAIALVGEPDLLILDEPTSGLDPNGIELFRNIVRRRVSNGTTVFFSSHVLSEVEAICDRVGVMRDGALTTVETVTGLRKTQPANASIGFELSRDGATVDGPERIVNDVDGARSVAIEGQRVTVDVASKAAKIEVLRRMLELEWVVDVDIHTASLQSVFQDISTADSNEAIAEASR